MIKKNRFTASMHELHFIVWAIRRRRPSSKHAAPLMVRDTRRDGKKVQPSAYAGVLTPELPRLLSTFYPHKPGIDQQHFFLCRVLWVSTYVQQYRGISETGD